MGARARFRLMHASSTGSHDIRGHPCGCHRWYLVSWLPAQFCPETALECKAPPCRRQREMAYNWADIGTLSIVPFPVRATSDSTRPDDRQAGQWTHPGFTANLGGVLG